LLHLDSSANRTAESVSRRLTRLFADGWRAAHPAGGYRYRDLVAEPVPPLDTAYCTLGRRLERHGQVPPADVDALVADPAEERAWAQTRPLIAELLAADTVVVGAPMYNFSISAALKVWLDRVAFPGAFTDPETGGSVLHGTQVVVVCARGGAYGPGTAREGWDFQTPYLRAYFAKQGIAAEDVRFVAAESTLAGLAPHLARYRPQAASSLAAARAELTARAARGTATVPD
jgi:FMN-dependent NADH-azoreductase